MDNFGFVSEKKDYSVSEFHDRFHKCLPKIVEVNQGVCSETGEETFGKGEVIVIAAISRQKRVVTEFKFNQKTRLISIPETYSEKLCIVREGRPGKEDLLLNILGHNKLPITVCFPRNRKISVGDKQVSTGRIPHLQLTETFDEVYLTGHYISSGEICKDVVHVPLYLSQLRVSIVNGLKGQPVEKWKHYKRSINHECSTTKYDQEFGNPDIAEYDPRAVHSGKALSYLEPMMYENIVNLIRTNDALFYPDMTPEEIDDLGLYEDIPLASAAEQRDDLYCNQPENNRVSKNNLAATGPSLPTAPFIYHSVELNAPSDTSQQREKIRPQIAPKPKLNQDNAHPMTAPPPLPTRQKSAYRQAKTSQREISDHSYSNLLPRRSVAPTVSVKEPLASTVQARNNPYYKEERRNFGKSKMISSSKDVAELSVEEVCEYLEDLNLSQYVDSFKTHMIDGAMLVELEPDLLREDIGMKKIEVARLMKFAKEGRLPVRT